ncbi:prepilin-type N-terminal cleavage/methylation domain-containing protein [candidate division GN15 bacterium]|nr:prepilin-type N-terminal cleavage/methylation domain-containing protein [candidate division GN15 bacterium]
MMTLGDRRGFTLIELVIIILVIGVLATISLRKMNQTVDTAAMEQTKAEMDQLARAIAGSADTYAAGARTEFGYVGDIGMLPDSLQDLLVNPGFETWNGPYIGRGFAADDFLKDGWGVEYQYTGRLIRSTGSGQTIEKAVAPSLSALTGNTVSGSVLDANRTPPNASWLDSVRVQLLHPDGTGGISTRVDTLDTSGRFSFANVPIGNHQLRVVYIPASDTMVHSVTVLPSRDVTLDIVCPADLW